VEESVVKCGQPSNEEGPFLVNLGMATPDVGGKLAPALLRHLLKGWEGIGCCCALSADGMLLVVRNLVEGSG